MEFETLCSKKIQGLATVIRGELDQMGYDELADFQEVLRGLAAEAEARMALLDDDDDEEYFDPELHLAEAQ